MLSSEFNTAFQTGIRDRGFSRSDAVRQAKAGQEEEKVNADPGVCQKIFLNIGSRRIPEEGTVTQGDCHHKEKAKSLKALNFSICIFSHILHPVLLQMLHISTHAYE